MNRLCILAFFTSVISTCLAAEPETYRFAFFGNVHKYSGIGTKLESRHLVDLVIKRVPQADGTVRASEHWDGTVIVYTNDGYTETWTPTPLQIERTAVERADGTPISFRDETVLGESSVVAVFDPQRQVVEVTAVDEGQFKFSSEKSYPVSKTALAPTRRFYDLLFDPPAEKQKREYAYVYQAELLHQPRTLTHKRIRRTWYNRLRFPDEQKNWSIVSETGPLGWAGYHNIKLDEQDRVRQWDVMNTGFEMLTGTAVNEQGEAIALSPNSRQLR